MFSTLLSILFAITSGRHMKLDNKKEIISLHSSTKIRTYYNIYKTDSPRSYTVTKCFVFFS